MRCSRDGAARNAVALRADEAEGDDVCACSGEESAMTAVSKKSRIITRSRYRRTDLLRQGKWRGARCVIASEVCCSGRRVACIALLFCSRSAASTGDDGKKGFGEDAKSKFANCVSPTARKTPPSGRPGQVKAPDGVSPQPQDRQCLACVLQACVV